MSKFSKLLVSVSLLSLASCSSSGWESDYPKTREEQMEERVGKLTGDDGLVIFGGKSRASGSATDAINVNSYLWRATLDTVHFMPLLSADPFGGTVITDWYQMGDNSHERYKLNIYIIGAELRSDALRVAAFKQIKEKNGNWKDLGNHSELAKDIEDQILLKAREIKFKSGR